MSASHLGYVLSFAKKSVGSPLNSKMAGFIPVVGQTVWSICLSASAPCFIFSIPSVYFSQQFAKRRQKRLSLWRRRFWSLGGQLARAFLMKKIKIYSKSRKLDLEVGVVLLSLACQVSEDLWRDVAAEFLSNELTSERSTACCIDLDAPFLSV